MNMDIRLLKETSDRLVQGVTMDFRRYLCSKIDWNNRLVCLKGARGTGKTTLMRQRIRERYGLSEKAFYLSLDNFWFTAHSPFEFIDLLYKNGVTDLFLDEVHHIEHGLTLIKTLYDSYPDLRVVYSGSSILRIDNQSGDLSRRQVEYELFEVGGKGKGFDQIRDLPDSYVVNDDVEMGFGNKIPLWLFGFLY